MFFHRLQRIQRTGLRKCRNFIRSRIVEYKVGQSENVNKTFLESYGLLPMVSKTAKSFVGQNAFYLWTPSQRTCQELSNKGSWIFVAYLFLKYFKKTKKLLFSKHGGMLHHWSFCQPSPFVPIFFWHFKNWISLGILLKHMFFLNGHNKHTLFF